MKCFTKTECREFIRHYLIAALWSSHDWRHEEDSPGYDPSIETGEMLDDSYDPDDLDTRSRAGVREDCLSFLRQCCEAGIDLRTIGGNQEWSSLAQHGHDFWLTRCGHGAGFWDRGYGAVGDQLSELARLMGNVDCLSWTNETFGIE